MRRWAMWGLVATAVLCAPASAHAQLGSGLVSPEQAQHAGLERAWYARARIDSSRVPIVRWLLSGDQLLLASAGVVHALDANTGQTLWISEVGNPDYPSLGPATNERFVAVVNGSTLYLLDRASGRVRRQIRLGGAPGAGPSLSKDYIFVPLLTGRVDGYPLEDGTGKTWFYQSFGRTIAPPRATPQSLVWGTDAGYLYVGGANEPGIRYRLETVGEFAAQPAYREPLIYGVTMDGELFAIDEKHGTLRWKYVTGFPTDRAPAVVDDRLYVTSEEPMLHAVDAATGFGQWQAPGISQFAAASKSRVYGVDRFGTVHVLDKASGASVGRIPSNGTLTALVNDQTDRLYLMTDRGLVQCLREIGATKPTYYIQSPGAVEEKQEKPERADGYRRDEETGAKPGQKPAQQPPLPPQGTRGPAGNAPPAEVDDNPFATPAAEQPEGSNKPADSAGFGTDADDPFN